jgi:glycosyltransferase involved in cell wall biosynthesis
MNPLNNKNMRVSVVVPMKNAEKYIANTLSNLLQQEHIDLEIVVVNDGSNDKSVEIVRTYNDPRIVLIDGLGKGIAEALNLGYRTATADIIARCDADDYFCPNDRLYQQAKFLTENPDFEAVCGNFYGMDQHDNHLGSFNCGDIPEEISTQLREGNVKPHFCSYAITKNIFSKVGGFRPYFVTAEDIDFSLRLAEQTRVMYFPDHVYIYRLHGSSITHTQPKDSRVKFEQAAKRFQQQRQLNGVDDIQLGRAKEIDEKNDLSEASSAKNHVIDLCIGNSWQLHSQQQKSEAIRLLWNIYKKNPTSLNLLKQLMLLISKKTPSRIEHQDGQ